MPEPVAPGQPDGQSTAALTAAAATQEDAAAQPAADAPAAAAADAPAAAAAEAMV